MIPLLYHPITRETSCGKRWRRTYFPFDRSCLVRTSPHQPHLASPPWNQTRKTEKLGGEMKSGLFEPAAARAFSAECADGALLGFASFPAYSCRGCPSLIRHAPPPLQVLSNSHQYRTRFSHTAGQRLERTVRAKGSHRIFQLAGIASRLREKHSRRVASA